MNSTINYQLNKATEKEIRQHLADCDADFISRLTERVELRAYARKIINHGIRLEAWSNQSLVGLLAMYCNDLENRVAYITSVSVISDQAGKGIASRLLNTSLENAQAAGMKRVALEVASNNAPAIGLYLKYGFKQVDKNSTFLMMSKDF